MPTRTATAEWNGSLRDGNGTMNMQSGSYEGPYSFQSRFKEGEGTNPEELIGAAHAGCFSMALSLALVEAGTPPESIATDATVHFGRQGDGFAITRIDLVTRARVPGVDADAFQQAAQAAKEGCPVSKALATEIALDASLEG